MYRRRTIAALAATGALALPAAASAHVTLQPSSVAAGGFTRLDVRVPNERDDSATTKVDIQLPTGFAFVSYEPRPGWKVTVRREKLDQPIETEDGFEIDEAVSQITWTGDGRRGAIAPGEFVDFGLSLRIPEGEAGDKLTFKALQSYDNGEVVRWIGPEDSEEPAPVVTLTKPASGGGHGAPGTAETTAAPGTPAAATVDDDGGADTISIAALIMGGLGLAAGLAALAMSRRRSRVAA